MTRELDKSTRSVGDRARSRAYLREFWPGVAAYVVILAAALIWGDLGGHSPTRFVWAVLPALPAVWIGWAVVRHIRRIDDYQRLLLLQGLAVGFALAMLASVTLGLLAVAGSTVPMTGWIIYAIGMAGWIVGGAAAARR